MIIRSALRASAFVGFVMTCACSSADGASPTGDQGVVPEAQRAHHDAGTGDGGAPSGNGSGNGGGGADAYDCSGDGSLITGATSVGGGTMVDWLVSMTTRSGSC